MSPRISIRLLAAQSDERLVALVRSGHERAFETVVQRYRRPLLRYCRRIGLADSRAEDVVQHALLNAWLALAGGAEVRELKPWLYRIVHNAAVRAMVRSGQDQRELSDAVRQTAAPAAESDLDRRMVMRQALTDVAALPQMQRQAILLTAVDGQTHDEVASMLGISHGAVRGLLYRARSTLRAAAAVLTPQPLINWASGAASPTAPTAERLVEVSAGGGAIGLTGVLLKGAATAVTVGALVGGSAIVHNHQHSAGLAGHDVLRQGATRYAEVGESASASALIASTGATSPALADALVVSGGRPPGSQALDGVGPLARRHRAPADTSLGSTVSPSPSETLERPEQGLPVELGEGRAGVESGSATNAGVAQSKGAERSNDSREAAGQGSDREVPQGQASPPPGPSRGSGGDAASSPESGSGSPQLGSGGDQAESAARTVPTGTGAPTSADSAHSTRAVSP